MNEIEKKIMMLFGDGNRVDCLARLGEQLQTADDRDRQKHILNVIAKVCSFETDAMFQAYIAELRKEAGYDSADKV